MFAVLNTGDVLGSWIPGGRGIPQFPKCDVGGGWLHRTSVTAALKQHWVRLPFPKRSSWWPNLSWCVSSDRMVLAVVRFHWKRGNSSADSGHLNKEEGVCQAQSGGAQNKDPSSESWGCPVDPTRWAYPPIHRHLNHNWSWAAQNSWKRPIYRKLTGDGLGFTINLSSGWICSIFEARASICLQSWSKLWRAFGLLSHILPSPVANWYHPSLNLCFLHTGAIIIPLD